MTDSNNPVIDVAQRQRIIEIRELKAVCATLGQQESWQHDGLQSQKILEAATRVRVFFSGHLNAYIRKNGVYGAFIRDDAYTEFLSRRAFFNPVSNRPADKIEPVDQKLALEILLHRESPERFSAQHGWCFERIHHAAEQAANRNETEKHILHEYYAEELESLGGEASPKHSASRIERLRFVEGFTEATRAAHQNILTWHDELRQRGVSLAL